MTILEAGSALRSRRISCLELTNRCLDHIAKLNPRLNAFIMVTGETARATAQDLDRELASGRDRGPLHGIPIAHKDLISTKGVRTTSGSKLFADHVPSSDARVVERLNAAGAVMVGKTGLHELAYGITSDNPHFGTIRNPRNPEHIPGGSSGGSAVAVATGMALMATGTDTGGSIRIPASYCGVVGIKPTYGLVSVVGVQPLGFSLDHIGPLTTTVGDARVSLDVMADGAQRKPAPASVREIRVGVPENYYFTRVAPEVRDAVHLAAKRAEGLGARIIPVQVPDIDAISAASLVILLSEAAALYEPYMDRQSEIGMDVRALLYQGRLVPATDYVNAQRLRKVLANEFRALFRSIDCLFTPATPITAPRIGQREVEIGGETLDTRLVTTRFARAFNALGFPALAMPCGETPEGMPIGLQMVGRPFEESLLFKLGEALE
ncbi:MAG TPA: amidase [Bryobacteraceae bacterium]|nr:amidase [Bryobacteraceae bacterium]